MCHLYHCKYVKHSMDVFFTWIPAHNIGWSLQKPLLSAESCITIITPIMSTVLCQSWRNFYTRQPLSLAFVGATTTFPIKSKMADRSHSKVRIMLIQYTHWMKIFANNFVYKHARQGKLRTATARRLSAYNVVESVSTTTTSSFSYTHCV